MSSETPQTPVSVVDLHLLLKQALALADRLELGLAAVQIATAIDALPISSETTQ